jgi:aminomuconate-semialdehyde/2-hydroxymuconate-6-semialdehyde dehydrogenase
MQINNLINGEILTPLSGRYRALINPATRENIGEVALSDHLDADKAIHSAQHAYPAWKKLSVKKRAELLMNLHQLINDHFEEFARWESINTGKPLDLARQVDIPRSLENLKFFAEFTKDWPIDQFPGQNKGKNQLIWQPLGVVSCITPWNLPLYLFTWKIAPALMAGNTVVAKPSEITPITAFLLGKLSIEAGFPPGVLNILHGEGANCGPSICSHPNIKAISFTGSTAVGQQIGAMAGKDLKKVSLEMGGKNAAIVFPDIEVKAVAKELVRSSFANQGQVCLCTSRLFVHQDIYQELKNCLINETLALQQGDPLSAKTQQGSVVSKEHFDKIQTAVTKAKQEGAQFLTGNIDLNHHADTMGGLFIQPMILEGLPYNAETNTEEIFGPLTCLVPFDDEQEVIAMANHGPYGLCASIWSEDIERAQRVAKELEVGMAWINTWLLRDLRTPFGGHKASGHGREGGRFALEFFSQAKNICIP